MTAPAPVTKWEAGIPEEVKFWAQWIKTRGQQWQKDFDARMDPQTPLQKYLVSLLNVPAGQEVVILDVGAGPATSLGKVYEGRQIKIIPIDPLADEYEKLWQGAGMAPPVKTLRVEGEKLLDKVAPNSVNIAHSRNAIDHSYDPLKIITSMLVATRPGGHVYIDLFENEAEKEGYAGFHQWNFSFNHGALHLWNQGTDILLNPILMAGGELQIKKTGERGITMIIKKNNELPVEYVKSTTQYVMA